jgi:hypothetical protein
MTYNPKSANPFTNNTFNEWTGNNLILTDPVLRRKAGVTVLDADITEMFTRPQAGGAAYGAPFHMSQYGSPSAVSYDNRMNVNSTAWVPQPMPSHKLAATQTGGEGSYPHRYF